VQGVCGRPDKIGDMIEAMNGAQLVREAGQGLPQSLRDDELVLVWRPLAADDTAIAALHLTLTAAERAEASRYHFERDRRRSVVSRGTLRAVLGRLLDRPPSMLELELGAHGKPALRGRELDFNVSHADAHLLIGVARHRALGVDVEGGPRSIEVEELAPTVFTPLERQALAAYAPGADRLRAFLRAWTRKEAYLKARSVGLSLPLKDFSVSLDASDDAVLSSAADPAEAARFALVGLPAPAGYEAALCWAKDGDGPPLERLRTMTL
jgi:4'-phosphopantetheinyl transferase